MTFEALLAQVLEVLQREERVSYRALQRQFDLDAPALADLKDALLFAEPRVVDEEGRGLVWTGAPPAATLSPSVAVTSTNSQFPLLRNSFWLPVDVKLS